MAPPPSSGRPSGSTTRPSSAGPTGTRTTSPVPRTCSPASTPSGIVEQHAAERSRVERRGEADLAAFEAHQLVKPHVRQAGHQRDAVGGRLDAADLLGGRRQPRRADARLGVAQPAVKIGRRVASRDQLLANPVKVAAKCCAGS